MKRGALIAALVLLPFFGLVAFGFSLLGDPPPISLPPPQVHLDPLPVAPPERSWAPLPPRPPPLPVVTTVIEPPRAMLDPAAPPEREKVPLDAEGKESKRKPIIAAIEPLVAQCFNDASDRIRENVQVTVQFDTTAAGGFAQAVIKKASWQDPRVTACILDSFEEARFEPSGTLLRRQHHTFTFSPADAGR